MARITAKATVDHDTIRRWVVERGARPACVGGALVIEFPRPGRERGGEALSWEAFFELFDEQRLAFVYHDRSDGKRSHFYQLMTRHEADIDQDEPILQPASRSSRPNAFEVLRRDHRSLERLFDQLEREVTAMRLEQLLAMIAMHAQMEEQIFYPALKDATASSARLVAQAAEDHELIDDLLAQLRDFDAGDPDVGELLSELKTAVLAHIAFEETKMFAEAERGLDEVDLAGLGRELEELRSALEERTSAIRSVELENAR